MNCLHKLSLLLAVIGFVSTNSRHDLSRDSKELRNFAANVGEYHCKNEDHLKTDRDVRYCAIDKWLPLPEGRDRTNIRECCFKLDMECHWAKVLRSFCEVRDGFDDWVWDSVDGVINGCKGEGIVVSEEICGHQNTNEVKNQWCNEYMKCSIRDLIKDRSWQCTDKSREKMRELDRHLDNCTGRKWWPLPEDRKLYDKRKCCYLIDRDCQWNRLTRDNCVVADEMRFRRKIERFYENTKEICERNNIMVSEEVCGQLEVKEVNEAFCMTNKKCSLNDPNAAAITPGPSFATSNDPSISQPPKPPAPVPPSAVMTTHCVDDQKGVEDMYEILDVCTRNKWKPLPLGAEDINERMCCYRMDRDCQWNHLIQEYCLVRNESLFKAEIIGMYVKTEDICKRKDIIITEERCGHLVSNEIKSDICDKYMKCSLKDEIIKFKSTTTQNPVPEVPHPVPKESSKPGKGARMTAQSWTQVLIVFISIFIERHLM